MNLTLRNVFRPFLLACSLWTAPLSGQTIQLDLDPATSCNFDGSATADSPVYGFDSSQEAEAAVRDILQQVGLPQNFIIKAANVPNAQAHVSRGERFILYSQVFMDDIYHRTGDYWSKVAVLAHEIAHHLLGHTLKEDGSRPLKELDADKWSGFVLYKMGASLAQAKLAAEALTSETGSVTHPPRAARLEAIAVGYNEARELSDGDPAAPRERPTPAQPERNESRTRDTSTVISYDQVELGGKTYKAIELNGLTWMAQNLDYESENSWCYDDDRMICQYWGRLYTWEAAKEACRAVGWRLPTDKEWRAMVEQFGDFGNENEEDGKAAYEALIAKGKSGFNAELGGYRSSLTYYGGFKSFGVNGAYWSATEKDADSAWYYHFVPVSLFRYDARKSAGFSCRCVQNTPSNGID